MPTHSLRSIGVAAFTLALALFVILGLNRGQSDARAQTATAPQVLVNGTAVGPLSAARQFNVYYSFVVPTGATRAVFLITGGSGDADLYVRRGSVPTTSSWDYRPYLGSSNETVTINNPAAGTWYVMVRAYSAYSGVFVKATHDAAASNIVATPTFSPAPGSYTGQVSVSLAVASPSNATIRFTVDGSTPSEASEVYNAPILLTRTSDVKAMAFANGHTPSAVASGNYRITEALQTLVNNAPVSGLSGARGSLMNFKFSVPSGVASVTFTLSGGTGDADLYVKYGQLATLSTWDQRPYTSGNNETVVINTPRAGDYFLMLHGYSAYSGTTLKGSLGGGGTTGKPDLTVSVNALNPRITNETFASNSCDVAEGTITAGAKKLLRFTTQSQNVGTADLVLGNPANNPAFEFGSCHGHYHFRSFAEYRLLNPAGAVVRTGRKIGFCLMDITRISGAANPSPRYTCSNQGIQAGWADVYSSNLSGQWIDITGVPAGQYVLEITMDPMNVIAESDETNNTVRANVTIP